MVASDRLVVLVLEGAVVLDAGARVGVYLELVVGGELELAEHERAVGAAELSVLHARPVDLGARAERVVVSEPLVHHVRPEGLLVLERLPVCGADEEVGVSGDGGPYRAVRERVEAGLHVFAVGGSEPAEAGDVGAGASAGVGPARVPADPSLRLLECLPVSARAAVEVDVPHLGGAGERIRIVRRGARVARGREAAHVREASCRASGVGASAHGGDEDAH